MNNSKKKKIIIISIIASIVVIAGLGLIFLLNSKDDEPQSETTEAPVATVNDASSGVADATTEEETTEAEIKKDLHAPEVEIKEDGYNRYTLTWDKQDSDSYKIFRKEKTLDSENSDWKEVGKVEKEESFSTGRLEPFSQYAFQVRMTAGSKTYESEELSIETAESPLYATVWTTRDMAVYESADGDSQIGSAPVLSAFSVLGEENGRFLVRTNDGEGYIDSNYCMINLPEYIGELCRYDITNSYSSIYCAHNYAIPSVTGTVVTGYEHVLLDDDTFVVPLLYPTAKKLIAGAKSARDGGYVIKINDSFRPYVATRYIYDETSKCLDYITPGYEYSRISLADYRAGVSTGTISLAGLTKYVPEIVYASEGDTVGTETIDPNVMTYNRAMLSDSYDLGAFLAAKGSTHNLGVAMDMTLETIDGTELDMQSHMHDLSYHSVMASNNSNANLLKNYMVPAGFGMISSEWWHFQDNDSKSTLGLSSVSNGVSIEGWKKNDIGWRYRKANGEYFVNCTEEINGRRYDFDKDGYTER